MKTIIALLATTSLLAGATSAMAADAQASDEATGYALSRKTDAGFGGAYASTPAGVRNTTVYVPAPTDFQGTGSR
jgi:hypothetical protein